MLPGFFFDTVGSGIREQQKDAAAKAERDNQHELEILQILAQHGSDDVRGVAGTAWLDLANNPNRPRAKGLGGFLGQTQKSPYFKDIQTAISSARVAQGPQPPSAGMSTNAPVSPGSSPITPAPAGPPATLSADPYKTATPAIAQQVDGMRTLTPPEDNLAAAPQAPPGGSQGMGGLAPIPTAPLVPPPPPPPKIRSLFPTAQEIAQDKANEQTMLAQAKEDQIAQSILKYGGSNQQVLETLQASHGNPPGRTQLESRIFSMRDGSTVMGSFDRRTGERLGPNGEPLDATQIIDERRAPVGGPKGPNARLVRDGNTGEWTWISPPEQGAPGVAPAPVGPVSSGVKFPEPAPPPDFAGTSVVESPDGKRTVVQNPRKVGGPSRVVGPAPSSGAAAKSPQQEQYKIWLKQVDTQLAGMRKPKNKFTTRPTVLTPAQEDAVVAGVTRQPGLTYNELAMGAAGQKVTPRGKSGFTRDEIIGALNGAARSQPGAVDGGTTITPAPPPPRR